MSAPDVLLVHGRPPSGRSVVADALALLRDRGLQVESRTADRAPSAELSASGLVLLRSIAPATALSVGCRAPAATWCNDPVATALAGDRIHTWQALRAAGVPVPHATVATGTDRLRRCCADRPMVVKTARDSRGRGVVLVDAGTPDVESVVDGAGPWLVQRRVAGDGWDRKLYVVGGEVRGRMRRWPPQTTADKLGRPFAVDADLAAVARATGTATGLCSYGVDIVVGPDGPVVVDVNALPGFKGVPGAAGWLAAHMAGHVDPGQVPACAS